MNDIKLWIKDNLQYSRGLICKKCKREWFEKYKFVDKWQEIHTATTFLDFISPTFPQRVWHIVFDQLLIKCANPSCQNIPKFWSFNEGYLDACSSSCAQYNPKTQKKIKDTNLQKYGTKYGLQNKIVKEKRIATLMEKYNITNISQLEGISEKKQKTCLKNYGTKWFLERQDLKEQYVKEKYGVSHIQQVPEVREKRDKTIKSEFYDKLILSDRFKNKVSVAFSKEEYDGVCKEYKFKCNVCLTIFSYDLRWDRIPRCPKCYPSVGTSLFEKEVVKYVKLLLPNDIVEENNRTILLNNYELDVYIPSKNLAIECNGLFWHGELGGNKSKTYHLSKTIECESKNIRLLHIFEDEWATKQIIVKSKINHILGLNKKNIIYARKCNIIEISSFIKKDFLLNNHIQGNDNAKICFGLTYQNLLVAVITFNLKRIFIGYKNKNDKDNGEYELCRYAALTDYNVIGGASKLLSHFIKTYKPRKIISYADRRWTFHKNNLYERIGFKKVSDGTPNYWYFGRDGNYRRFHRFGFAKHTLVKRLASFDPNLTEWENMKNNGWDRIWDCGNLKCQLHLP